MQQPLVALIEQNRGQHHQRQRVDESRQHSRALVTVGSGVIAGPRLPIDSESRQQQGKGVGEVVARVGEQRQAARAESGERLEHHKA